MPKHKQPTSLQAIAMEVLVEFTVQFCIQRSTEGTLKMLRDGIIIVKEHFCHHIPWCSLPEFCTKFLGRFHQKLLHNKRHYEAALEIVLDVEFVGLRCDHKILRYLNQQNVHRLRGLVELELRYDSPEVVDFNLSDLKTLILPHTTSDEHLQIIGKNCLKLRVLKVNDSDKIRDGGLCALSSCSDLRVVDIYGCFRVTDTGVNHLISALDKLEELSHASVGGAPVHRGIYSLNRPSLVMKRICVETPVLTNANLRSIVSMFPNLTHFGTRCQSVEDLSILKSLNNLEAISCNFWRGNLYFDDERDWQRLKELLTFVGGNIKTLSFCSSSSTCENFGISYVPERTGLDFIFRSCPNIEYLELGHGDYDLVIPPFKKLKTLKLTQIHISDTTHTRRNAIELSNIGEMLNLEELTIENFKIGFRTVKAIVLDDVKFPKLIRINSCNVRKIDEIREIVKNNNLDFQISK